MKFLSHLLRAGYFFVLIELINSYLLIAANLNDFRSIAKKLVPKDFANRLTKVISNPGLGKVPETSYENSDYEESDNLSDNTHPNIKVKAYKKPKINLGIKGTKVDFDELVERVKKRVEKELRNKYIEKKQNDKETKTKMKEKDYAVMTDNKPDKIKVNNYQKLTSPIAETNEEEAVYENLEYEEPVSEKPKYVQKVKFTTKEDRYEYADAMADSEAEKEEQVENNEKKTGDKIYYDIEGVTQNDLYKKVDMVKKDSYEDYKIPDKENIYSSSEKQNNKRFKIEQRKKSTKKVNYGYKEYVSKVKKSEEIAAVTADILYDYNDTEIISDGEVIEKNNKAIDKKFGTMIPKRELYTIVTPNYLDNIPHVVEKYNFNEPIPERDQERDDVKYYGNPPASVNKKVRLL